MIRHNLKFKFFIFLLVMITNVNAQVLPQIKTAFDTYFQGTFQEKIFVHTDQEVYLSGELLWFKVYILDASTNLPTNLSKVVYVEVLDQQNNAILQAKIDVKSKSGSGSFYIPINIASGDYKLRAYTSWMRNEGTALFFEKKFVLINPQHELDKQAAAKNDIDLQFFPEGGDLISGITGNVAFKTLGNEGKGIDIKGVVINQKNDTVARFQSLKFGIGKFSFTPLDGNTYKAIASAAKGDIVISDLPLVKKQGYSINLSAGMDNIQVKASTNLNVKQVFLIVHQAKKISIAQSLELANGAATFQINQANLADGINHITLFSETGKPVCERLYFKKPTKRLNIDASADLLTYQTRKKVTLSVFASDEKEIPLAADLSISVHRVDSLQELAPEDIANYFWLSAELKGEIESPAYYFAADDEAHLSALDHLLLTQGWRRFAWDKVLTNSKPIAKFLPEINGHLINGTLTELNGNPAVNKDVYLGIPGKRLQFYVTRSDSTGHFVINTKDFYGSNESVLQTNYQLDSASKITVQSPFAEQFNNFDPHNFSFKPTMLGALQLRNLGVQVQNNYSGKSLKQFYYPGIDSAAFYGQPYKSYNLNDYVRFVTMEEVLREYVREVFVSIKQQNNFQLKVLGKAEFLPGEPLILIDGVPNFVINRVMAMDPLKIERLDVVNDRYFYGSGMFDGILSFSSTKNNLSDTKLSPNAIVIDYEGMQLQREFYSPTYETEIQLKNRVPDFRQLLFWTPTVSLDKGKAQMSFYTSDQPGSYIGIVQGLSVTGIPGSKIFRFEVKK